MSTSIGTPSEGTLIMKDAMPLIAGALAFGAVMAFVLAFSTASSVAEATGAIKSSRNSIQHPTAGYGSDRVIMEVEKTYPVR